MNFRAFSVTKTPPAWIADTCVGTKTNAKSYRCIATMSGAPEHRFFSFGRNGRARRGPVRRHEHSVDRRKGGEGASGEHSVIHNLDSLG